MYWFNCIYIINVITVRLNRTEEINENSSSWGDSPYCRELLLSWTVFELSESNWFTVLALLPVYWLAAEVIPVIVLIAPNVFTQVFFTQIFPIAHWHSYRENLVPWIPGSSTNQLVTQRTIYRLIKHGKCTYAVFVVIRRSQLLNYIDIATRLIIKNCTPTQDILWLHAHAALLLIVIQQLQRFIQS